MKVKIYLNHHRYKIWNKEIDILKKSQAYLRLSIGTNKVKYQNQKMINLSIWIEQGI